MSTYDDILEEYRRRKNGEANGTPDTSSPTEQTAGGSSYDDIAAEYQRIRGGGQTSATTVPEEQPVQPVTQRPTPSPLRPGRAALIQDETAQQQVQTPQKSFASDPFGFLFKQAQQQAGQAKQPGDPTAEAWRGKTLPGGQRMETIDPGRLTQESGAEDYAAERRLQEDIERRRRAQHSEYRELNDRLASGELDPHEAEVERNALDEKYGVKNPGTAWEIWEMRHDQSLHAESRVEDYGRMIEHEQDAITRLQWEMNEQAFDPAKEPEYRQRIQEHEQRIRELRSEQFENIKLQTKDKQEAAAREQEAFNNLSPEEQHYVTRNVFEKTWDAIKGGSIKALTGLSSGVDALINFAIGDDGLLDMLSGGAWSNFLGGVANTQGNPYTELVYKPNRQTAAAWNAKADRIIGPDAGVRLASDATAAVEMMLPYILLNAYLASSAAAVTPSAASSAMRYTAGVNTATSSYELLSLQFTHASLELAGNASAQYTFLQEFGNGLLEAEADGADKKQAALYALYTATLNTIIEFSGGVEDVNADLRRNPYSALSPREMVSTIFHEDLEELAQGFVGDAFKSVYQEVNYFSGDDPVISKDKIVETLINTTIATPFITLAQVGVTHGFARVSARVDARDQRTANQIVSTLDEAAARDQASENPESDAELIRALEEIGSNRRLSRVFKQMYKTSPQEAIESIRQTEAAETPAEAPSVSPVADSSLTERATGEEEGSSGTPTPTNPVRPQEAAGAPVAQGGTETAAQAAETHTAQTPVLNSQETQTAPTQSVETQNTTPQSAEQTAPLAQGSQETQGVETGTEERIATPPSETRNDSAEAQADREAERIWNKAHPYGPTLSDIWEADKSSVFSTYVQALGVDLDMDNPVVSQAYSVANDLVAHNGLPGRGPVSPYAAAAALKEYLDGHTDKDAGYMAARAYQIERERAGQATAPTVQTQESGTPRAASPTVQTQTPAQTNTPTALTESTASEAQEERDRRYRELGEQYGTIEAGENPARESAVPRQIDERRKTGETARTIYEAGATPERRLSDIEKAVVDGKFSYVSIDNETLADKASEKVQRDGWDAALRDWTAAVRAGKANENLVAMGATLLNNAGNSDLDWKGYVDLASDYNRLMHSLGRGLAAARILKTLSPEGRLYGIQRSVESMNEELEQKYKDKAKKNSVEIDPKLIEEYRKAETDAERDEIIGRMQQNIADQIPSTLYDKWVSLRYLNMLGNFKTQIRNVLGNVTMMVTASLKNHLVRGGLENIAYGVNRAAAKATGGKVKGAFEREVAMGFDRNLYADAWADFKNVEKEALGEKRYSDSSRQFDREIQDKRRIWKNNGTWGTEEGSNALLRSLPMKGVRKGADLLMGGLNVYSKLTEAAMEYGDQIFSRMTYADAMASWMKAHNVKHLADMSPEMLERARMFAIQEAQEATFRDSNGVSSWFSKAGRGAKTPFGKFMEVVGEGIMPFRKTPANVLVRGFEYSPLGILSTGVNAIKAIKGTATGHDVINSLSKTFTGTGLAYLGYLLAAAGLLRTKDDDDKLEKFNKDSGQLDYSINIGGKSITLDWLAPDCIPLFMGAAFQNVTADGGFQADDALKILGQLTEPMLEMSMLSGVQDAIEGAKDYSGTMDGVPMLVLNSLLSWATQGVSNSLVRQGEQASEQYRRQSYTSPDNQLPTGVQRKLSQYFSGIPGYDYQQVDYIDAWGRRQDQGSQGARIAQSLFNPANISPDRSTPYDDELRRLYKNGNTGVLPQAPAFNTTVNDTRLTPEEWERYATVGGEKRLELIGDFLDSEEYKRLDDDTRAAIIGNLYEYSNWLAGREIARQRGEEWNDSWDKVESVEKAGVNPADYLLGRKQADTDGSGGTPSNQEVYNWLLGSDYSERQQRAIWDATKGSSTKSWDEYRDTNPVTYLMNAGLSQKGAQRMYAQINTDGRPDLTQRELYQYYLAHPEAEELIREYWDNQRGFSDSWAKAKSRPKKDWTD